MSKFTAFRTEVLHATLRISEKNSRKNRGTAAHKAKVAELAESIATFGLLQNLVGHANGDYNDVDAGGTRYEAIGLLIEDGRWPADKLVPMMIIGADEAVAASYTENAKRFAMHPADEFDAFVTLIGEGWTIDKIADNFGVTPLVVERRIKLQAAAPELIQLFRADAMTTDQLIALCSTDNHVLQLDVWHRTSNNEYARTPKELRAAVIDTEIEASKDPRVALIGGVEAYEKAGGKVRQDLFSGAGNDVILEDGALVATLLFQKMEAIAEECREEGWKWVEVWPKYDYSEYSRFGEAPYVRAELTEESKQQLQELNAEVNEVVGELNSMSEQDNPKRYQELRSRRNAAQDQISQLQIRPKVYAPEVVEHSGVVVMYYVGSIRIERGRVRTEDRSQLQGVMKKGEEILGGRESKPAGRKPDAVSDSLRRSLLGYKNLAAQRVTATNPHAAKALLVSQMVGSMRANPTDAPTDYTLNNGWGTRTYCKISDEAGVAEQKAFEAASEALIAHLPTDSGALWDALYALPASELDMLLALAVARSVSLADEPGRGMSEQFVGALGLDMATHFAATAGNYLGRVSKELILEALDEVGKVQDDADRAALMAMKKGTLAKEAETRLEGAGWVPKLIRTEKAEKPANKKVRRKSRNDTA